MLLFSRKTRRFNYLRVFHKSLNVAVKPARMRVWHPRAPRSGEKNAAPSRRAWACPSPCVWLAALITPVGQDRQILTRSGSGEPELQRGPMPSSIRPPAKMGYIPKRR